MSLNKSKESLHSEEINNIIASPPKWILRWGPTLFLFILAALALICSVIPYPDIVKTGSRISMEDSNLVAEVSVPEIKISKIKKGQAILVKLTGYPFQQYGMARGRITGIQDVPDNNNEYTVKASLDTDTLDGKHHIVIKKGMTASAEIIVEEITLLKQIFRSIFNSHQ
jgi:hypothetical protein